MKEFKMIDNLYFFLFNLTNRIMSEKPITEQDCFKWKKNKLINPHTDYHFKAKEKSKIYKRFEKECSKIRTPIQTPVFSVMIPTQKKPITADLCYKWLNNNKKKNPITNAPIKPDAKLYKNLEEACIKLKVIDAKTKVLKKPDLIPEVVIKTNVKYDNKNPIYKPKRDITEEDCINWRKNKLLNPHSKNGKGKIKRDGPLYKTFQEICEKKSAGAKPNISKELKDKIAIKFPNLKGYKQKKTIDELTYILNCKTIKEAKEYIKELENKPKPKTPEPKPVEPKEPKPVKPKTPKPEPKPVKPKTPKKNLDEPYYPSLDDSEFNKKLLSLKEISVHKIDKYPDIKTIGDFEKKASDLCGGFDKSSFQYLMAHYLSYRTPYRSLLLYYSVGIGKTCTAITIAESLLVNHNSFEEAKIWVILPGAIEEGFKNQIFDAIRAVDFSTISNQCTGDTYVKLTQISKETDIKVVEKRIKKLIKSRYSFFTYEGFANFIETNYIKKNRIVKDKVIIVDEAHNIRSGGEEDENKRVYDALIYVCSNHTKEKQETNNNRLVLLTATPMYNEPTDIYNLFYLLLKNDNREDLYDKNMNIFDSNNQLTTSAKKFISFMSSNYISYLRGKNPFNFAFKLSPKLSGIPVLENAIPLKDNGEPIDTNDKDWVANMDNGIVTAKLSKKQLDYIKLKKQTDEEKNQHNNFNVHQPMNIVYDKSIGKEGFNNFFIRQGTGEQVIVKYASKYKDALAPDEKNLGVYSGKFLNIADIIKKSKGVVVIYSRFKWSGVIPLAITLEHMGFTREGTTNLLSEPSIKEKVTYEGISTPKYCILSSTDPEVMGNTTIDGLMSKINNPANLNGELVKVVLMTPVAGEGLNFYNVREIHITDPWYHFNKIDQIIGRGIRNCSHKRLPVEERNVTVFMHCSINDLKKETTDIHAYRIATRKLYQSFIVDEVIRNSAIDCSLFKSINFFPKSMFKLGDIDIKTSQGKKIKYKLGDEDKYKPVCNVNIEEIKVFKEQGFREETYKHLAINIQSKLKKLILESIQKNQRFISFETIKQIFDYVDPKILMHSIKISIYPNIIIDNIMILPHQDGIHIIDVVEDSPLKLHLISNQNYEEVIEVKNDFYNKINGIEKDNYYNAIIALYLSLDEITFKTLITKIFKLKTLNKIDTFIETCFVKEGVLIKQKEIPSVISSDKYIGFVNIFNEDFEPLIYSEDGNHKSLNQKQMQQLKSNRIYMNKPDDLTKETKPWGLIVPVLLNKEAKIKTNSFKLLTTDVVYGKKTGIVCSYLKKGDHLSIMKQLNLNVNTSEKNTKFTFCNKIAIELLKINRLTILPDYKPK